MEYRYENIKLKYMTVIKRMKSYDGKIIIYVNKCDKFEKKSWN